jgi:hypothetical protein
VTAVVVAPVVAPIVGQLIGALVSLMEVVQPAGLMQGWNMYVLTTGMVGSGWNGRADMLPSANRVLFYQE